MAAHLSQQAHFQYGRRTLISADRAGPVRLSVLAGLQPKGPRNRISEHKDSWLRVPVEIVLLSLALILSPCSLLALELRSPPLKPDSFPHLLLALPEVEGPEMFTAATRIPQANGEGLLHSYVVVGKDVPELDVGGVAALLELLPPVLVLKSGYPGQPAWLGLGGVAPLVLLDGVPFVPSGWGEIDLSSLSRVSLARVEVVREGLSSLYGSGAGAGVINLISKSFPGGKPFTRVGIARGTHDTQLTELEFARGMGERLGLWLGWDWKKTQGYRANSDWDTKYVNGDLRYSMREDLEIELRGERIEGERGAPGAVWDPSSQRCFDLEHRILLQLDEGDRRLQVYGRDFSLDLNDPDAHESSRVGGFSLVERFESWKHAFIVGADGRQEELSLGLAGSHRRGALGIFGQGQIELHPLLCVLPSLRYDFPWHQLSPRVGVTYCPTLDLRFFGSLGRSFRAPTLRELYLNPSCQPFDSLGNPDLEEETVVHSNLGCAFRGEGFSLRAFVFLNRVEDRIGWDCGETDWTVSNHGASSAKGFELSIEKEALPGLSTGMGIFYQSVGGASLPLSPEVRSNFWAAYGTILSGGNVELRARLTGEYVEERFPCGDWLDTHLLFNLRGEVKLIDVSFFYHLDNLLAESYELLPGYPMPGRTASFGLSWEFWD